MDVATDMKVRFLLLQRDGNVSDPFHSSFAAKIATDFQYIVKSLKSVFGFAANTILSNLYLSNMAVIGVSNCRPGSYIQGLHTSWGKRRQDSQYP